MDTPTYFEFRGAVDTPTYIDFRGGLDNLTHFAFRGGFDLIWCVIDRHAEGERVWEAKGGAAVTVIRGADTAIVLLHVESIAVVWIVFRPERSFQQNNQFQHQSRLIPPGSDNSRFISSITMSTSLIPRLEQRKLQFQEPLSRRWLWCICGLLLFTPLQEFLFGIFLLGIFNVSFEMSIAIPNSSWIIGYKCTNLNCLHIFPNLGMLLRHKRNRHYKGTDCTNIKLAKKVYEIKDNRADSLQPSRIAGRLLSSDVLHPAVALLNDFSA
jgi:hypothetical protein